MLDLCRALREKVLAQADPDSAEARPSDGTYKGINNYTDYTKVCTGSVAMSLPSFYREIHAFVDCAPCSHFEAI